MQPIRNTRNRNNQSRGSPSNQLQRYDQRLYSMQASIEKLANSVNNLITHQIKNQKQNQNHTSEKSQIQDTSEFKSDPRYRFIKVTIPTITQQSNDRSQTIKDFMGQLCKKVFQNGFGLLIEEKLEKDQVKIYCSQNILYSTIQLIKKNNLNPEEVKAINDCLKEEVLPYMAQKYPLTDGEGGNAAFEKQVVPQNNIDDDQYDLVSKSGVAFKLKQSGNYNSEIMAFLNNLIELSISLQKGFQKDISSFFSSIFVEEQLNEIQRIDVQKLRENKEENQQKQINNNKKQEKQTKNKQQITNNKYSTNEKSNNKQQENNNNIPTKLVIKQTPQKLKQKADYKEKVRSYTDYRIGKKIPSSIKTFSKKQISSGDLRLNSPALSRILTKWCEELQKCFDSQNIINREKPFRMMDGSFNFLPKKCWNSLLYLLLKKEEQAIMEYKNQILEHSNKMQKKLTEANYKELKLYSSQQATVGCFAVGIEKINESYLIGYINKLIHGILSATTQYCKLIKRGLGDYQAQKTNQSNLQDYIKQYDKQQVRNDINQKDKSPILITFKVGDLLRCKCSSKERQIIALYKKLQKISHEQPDKMRIVRVKNRLAKGTKDILINLQINNRYLAEVQLAIITGKSKFIKSSSYFSHYLYQLQRAQFGPINQMCNIWTNKDGRSMVYQNAFETKGLSRNLSRKSIVCQHSSEKQTISLPFICDQCSYFFSGVQSGQVAYKCNKCNQHICSLCHYDYLSKCDNEYIKQQANKLPKNKSMANKIFELIPNVGKITSKLTSERQLINYIKAETSKTIYLLQEIKNNKFQPIIEINKSIYPSKATPLYQAKQHYIKMIRFLTQNNLKEEDFKGDFNKKIKQIKECFLIPLYLINTHKEEKNSINLIKENISENAFKQFKKKFKQDIKAKHKKQGSTNQKQISMMKEVQTLDLHYLKKLNLSQNNIEDISNLTQYSQLETLILNYNEISEIPENNWVNLTILKLRNNKFKVFNPKNLIYKKSNRDKEVKSYIKQIDLSSNMTEQINQNIQNLSQLANLNISCNEITEIPKTFGNLPSLHTFDISDNEITHLPETFGNLSSLHKFDVCNNKITHLPTTFDRLASLHKFDVCNNKITHLPETFNRLSSLHTFDIHNNKITHLPEAFGNLPSLHTFDISQNRITHLPEAFGKLPSLYTFYSYSNKIAHLPETFGSLSSLHTFDIHNNKITHLPETFGNLPSLHTFDIHNNKITHLPETFGNLPSLHTFNISFNKITHLPEIVGNLPSLHTFDISFNKITHLPQSFGTLASLHTFKIRSNQIKYLPETFGNLRSLHTFDICNNKMKYLPETFGNLPALHKFDISYNQIAQLPKTFKNLSVLDQIYLKNNNLSEQQIQLLPSPFNYQIQIDYDLLSILRDRGIPYKEIQHQNWNYKL